MALKLFTIGLEWEGRSFNNALCLFYEICHVCLTIKKTDIITQFEGPQRLFLPTLFSCPNIYISQEHRNVIFTISFLGLSKIFSGLLLSNGRKFVSAKNSNNDTKKDYKPIISGYHVIGYIIPCDSNYFNVIRIWPKL